MTEERSCYNCGDIQCRGMWEPIATLVGEDLKRFETEGCEDWEPRPDGEKR